VSENNWADVDRYIAGLFVWPDPELDAARAASDAAGLPAIEVSPPHGKLLMLLAKMIGAQRILEIGTLGGYSTIWMARALPADGKLVSLEADRKHAEIARKNIAAAGLGAKVDIRIGPALDTLPKLEAEAAGPFDLIFLDADKPNNPAYFQWALKLARLGSVIVADNVVRYGAVIDMESTDASVKGAQSFLRIVAEQKRVSATAIQTVGLKGHDGFAIAVVIAE
jgi:predicted O-methyltransferase YrrM